MNLENACWYVIRGHRHASESESFLFQNAILFDNVYVGASVECCAVHGVR
jgi:hypothetical protein